MCGFIKLHETRCGKTTSFQQRHDVQLQVFLETWCHYKFSWKHGVSVPVLLKTMCICTSFLENEYRCLFSWKCVSLWYLWKTWYIITNFLENIVYHYHSSWKHGMVSWPVFMETWCGVITSCLHENIVWYCQLFTWKQHVVSWPACMRIGCGIVFRCSCDNCVWYLSPVFIKTFCVVWITS